MVAMRVVCVGDGWPPHHAGGLGGITCSCVGPSAGGASPGAGLGSSHRPQWGLGPAPQSPAAPSSGSSGTGCRSAPLPGWTGTVGPEQLALVGRIWTLYPTREASHLPPPAPSWGLGVLTGRPQETNVSELGKGPKGPAQQEGFSLGSALTAPHRALALHPLPLHPLHLPLPSQVLRLHHTSKAQVLLRVLMT